MSRNSNIFNSRAVGLSRLLYAAFVFAMSLCGTALADVLTTPALTPIAPLVVGDWSLDWELRTLFGTVAIEGRFVTAPLNGVTFRLEGQVTLLSANRRVSGELWQANLEPDGSVEILTISRAADLLDPAAVYVPLTPPTVFASGTWQPSADGQTLSLTLANGALNFVLTRNPGKTTVGSAEDYLHPSRLNNILSEYRDDVRVLLQPGPGVP